MRISLAASPNGQRQQEADTSRSEASHINTKPNVSRRVNANQERCAPEMEMREHQAPAVTALTHADEETKWQSEYSTYPTKWNFQPAASSIDDTMGHHNSQRSESGLVEFNVLQASDVSDFDFSFGLFFDKDIEYPSWPDSTFSMDRPVDIGESSYRRQPMDEPPLHEEKRANFTDSPPKTDKTSPSHVNFDDVYLTHFERLINNCGYSSKEDGKGNYLRFILDYIKSSHCSRESPFRFAVLAWAAKHLAATSFSENESWKIYYTQAVQALERISCCGDPHDTSELGAALPTGQYAISSKAELTISSALFLCRCDVLNGDSDSILSRLDDLKEHLICHLSDPSLSALACKFLLWLCYIDVRLRIFSSILPSGDRGESNPITTLLDALIHHPKYDYVLSRSHSYLSETFGYTYPPNELVQDEKKVPISVRTHETFCLISNMLQYRSWKHIVEQKPDFPGYRELAEAKETAISLDIRRMDTEFDLAIATNPAANTLRNITSPRNDSPNCGISTHMVSDNLDLRSLPPVTISRDIDRASLEWLSCYAAFLSAKVLWSRLLYPTVRSDSTAMVATSGILKIALQIRQTHRKSKLASLMKVPRSMLWPLPVFIAGIETTDEIYADWIREFMNEMASAMNNIARERSHITGEDLNHPRENKTDHLVDQKLILVLMMRVREKQDLLGRRVDVQGIMSEANIANNVFLI